jgi:AhpD family alkylhydroperoxidase
MPLFPSLPRPARLGDLLGRFPDHAGPLLMHLEGVMHAGAPLSAAQCELIAAYVSGLNACAFCLGSHRIYAEALGVEPGLIEALLQDLETAPMSFPSLSYGFDSRYPLQFFFALPHFGLLERGFAHRPTCHLSANGPKPCAARPGKPCQGFTPPVPPRAPCPSAAGPRGRRAPPPIAAPCGAGPGSPHAPSRRAPPARLQIGQRQRLADRIPIGPRETWPTGVPSGRKIGSDPLASAVVASISSSTISSRGAFASIFNQLSLFRKSLSRRIRPSKPAFLRPILGAVIAPPGAVALFQPQRHQRPAAHRAPRPPRARPPAALRRASPDRPRRSAAPSPDRR